MDLIETRLKQGVTPRNLILEGFKKSTVYKVNKYMKTKRRLDIDDTINYLFFLMQQAFLTLDYENHKRLGDEMSYDSTKLWNKLLKDSNESYTDITGKQPPYFQKN